mmetsp:Transcript_73292/g.214913  ORF Transcript_73292/g.214913 Transcript_73292/m.214913 type:complete len:85 (-) Transcript_73292:605-859(-)
MAPPLRGKSWSWNLRPLLRQHPSLQSLHWFLALARLQRAWSAVTEQVAYTCGGELPAALEKCSGVAMRRCSSDRRAAKLHPWSA